MCNHVLACARTQETISHLSVMEKAKTKKHNTEKICEQTHANKKKDQKVEIETGGAIISSTIQFFLSKCHIRLAFNAPFNSHYHVLLLLPLRIVTRFITLFPFRSDNRANRILKLEQPVTTSHIFEISHAHTHTMWNLAADKC